jgi:hypothetical protein
LWCKSELLIYIIIDVDEDFEKAQEKSFLQGQNELFLCAGVRPAFG